MNNHATFGDDRARRESQDMQQRPAVHQPLPSVPVRLQQVVHSLRATETYRPSTERGQRLSWAPQSPLQP